LRHPPAEFQVNPEIPDGGKCDRNCIRHIAVGEEEIENHTSTSKPPEMMLNFKTSAALTPSAADDISKVHPFHKKMYNCEPANFLQSTGPTQRCRVTQQVQQRHIYKYPR